MGFDYFIFYTEASLVCVVILSIILINDRVYNTKQEKQVWFSRETIAFIVYFTSDAFWAAMLSGLFHTARPLVVFINFLNYVVLGLMGYGLFMFIGVSGNKSFLKGKKVRFLYFLPVILSALVISIAYVRAPLFWIDENNKLNFLYYPMMIVVPFFYLLAGFILSVKYAVTSKHREEKKHFLIMGSIPFGVMAFGMVQVVGLNAPTFCFGCTIMWLLFYIQNMQNLISVDDLTRLNNRGQINRFMAQVHYTEGSKILIMMMDINRFKGINDQYGHAEGDRALVTMAEALRQAFSHIKASVFLGRYGGDEFTVIIQNQEEEYKPDELSKLLRDTLREKKNEKNLPYDLDVSIGYDEIIDEKDTVRECMKRADRMLYRDKQRNFRGSI